MRERHGRSSVERRPRGQRHAGVVLTAGAMGLWVVACGAPPANPPEPYRIHPSPEAIETIEPSPSPRPPRKSPPPETDPPAAYPYPTPPLPDADPYEAVGMVLLNGRPIEGITVSVVNNQTFRSVRVTTDALGIYRVRNLATGSYFVHYYNDRDNFKIGYWKTLVRPVNGDYGARYPAFDLYLVGMQNSPGMGAAITLPTHFEWKPYALALRYRFRIHNRGGPSGKPYFVSNWLGPEVTRFPYDGTINQKGMGSGKLAPGRYLWGVYWDAGQAGEGGNLYQDFIVRATPDAPALPPPDTAVPPADEAGGRIR